MGRARPSATAHLSFLTVCHWNCPGAAESLRILIAAEFGRRLEFIREQSGLSTAGHSGRAGARGAKRRFEPGHLESSRWRSILAGAAGAARHSGTKTERSAARRGAAGLGLGGGGCARASEPGEGATRAPAPRPAPRGPLPFLKAVTAFWSRAGLCLASCSGPPGAAPRPASKVTRAQSEGRPPARVALGGEGWRVAHPGPVG